MGVENEIQDRGKRHLQAPEEEEKIVILSERTRSQVVGTYGFFDPSKNQKNFFDREYVPDAMKKNFFNPNMVVPEANSKLTVGQKLISEVLQEKKAERKHSKLVRYFQNFNGNDEKQP